MMKFAWDNYKRYAWGKNELRPLTKNGHIGNMFASSCHHILLDFHSAGKSSQPAGCLSLPQPLIGARSGGVCRSSAAERISQFTLLSHREIP
ncbi:Mannosyl-oligosaccharide 12-alpha-mannosidase IC, partial [Dissostichus eleginoides]